MKKDRFNCKFLYYYDKVCMVYLDNYSYCLARRVQKCGARKFKLLKAGKTLTLTHC
jgi:hypothetical protein